MAAPCADRPVPEQGKAPVIVNASCNFIVPLVYPGTVEVRMFLGQPGRTSVDSTTTCRRRL